MNLIILTSDDVCDGGAYRLTDHRAEHIRSILRSVVGDTVEIGLLGGPSGLATITRLDDSEVRLEPGELVAVPSPEPIVDLICALPRPQTLKKVLISSGTMGVRRLHLVRANRVERSYYQSPLLQPENYRPFLIEGISQGKLTRLPEVHIHDRFRRFFEDDLVSFEKEESQESIKLVADLESGATLDRLYRADVKRLLLAIGPEGGWVPFELELMQGLGFEPFTLGRWILRVENAVTAALGQIELVRMSHSG